LCYRFYQFGIFRNYNLILSRLNFRTLYSRRRHLDALFLINAFKGKINCHSIMDTIGIRVSTRQIRVFLTFTVSGALRHSPSATCVIAANDICRFLTKTLSPLRTPSRYEKLKSIVCVLFCLVFTCFFSLLCIYFIFLC
jgi:hypothetical protein